jgi:hypothetical protein
MDPILGAGNAAFEIVFGWRGEWPCSIASLSCLGEEACAK